MIDNYDIQDAYDSLESIKTHTNENIDGEVIYAALSLFTWAGMEKKEIGSAKIQDIVDNGDNIIGININNDNNEDSIRLFGHPKQVLIEYRQYLNSCEDYDTNLESPLFPVYIGKSGERKLSRHLKNLGDTYSRWCRQIEWELGLLKEIGRFDYYLKMKESVGSEDIALQETATQFRISERQAKDVIKKCRQITPCRFGKYLRHRDQMYGLRGLDFSNEAKIEEYKKEGFRLIDKLPGSSEERLGVRQSFQSELSEERKKFFRKQSEESEPTQRLTYQELIRILSEKSTPTEENSSPPNLDWIESMGRDDCNDEDDQEIPDEN